MFADLHADTFYRCFTERKSFSDLTLHINSHNIQSFSYGILTFAHYIPEDIDDKFDCLVSNPPYISYDEEIEDIVKNNEPSIALYAANDGLYFYDKILKMCSSYLNEKYLKHPFSRILLIAIIIYNLFYQRISKGVFANKIKKFY